MQDIRTEIEKVFRKDPKTPKSVRDVFSELHPDKKYDRESSEYRNLARNITALRSRWKLLELIPLKEVHRKGNAPMYKLREK